MPTREIDETELLRLQQQNQILSAVLAHPEAGKLAEKAVKMVHPNLKTPRLDQEAAFNAPVQELRKQIADLAQRIEENTTKAEQDKTLNALAEKRTSGLAKLRSEGWTDEGISHVEKLMETKGILDPLDAAAIYEKHNPPPPPANPTGTGAWNFMESVSDDSDADLKKLIEGKGQDEFLVDQMARKALHETRMTARR